MAEDFVTQTGGSRGRFWGWDRRGVRRGRVGGGGAGGGGGFVTQAGGSRGGFWGWDRGEIRRERSGRGCRVGRRVGVGYACLRFEVSTGAGRIRSFRSVTG